jgi:hypothetical protein
MTIIKTAFSLFFALFSINLIHCQVTFWENLTDDERSAILSGAGVSRLAIDYQNGSMQTSADSLTYAMLSAVSDKGDFNQFHFYVFNKVLSGAEGQLAEEMSHYCLKIFLNYPEQLVSYFSDENNKQSVLYSLYVKMLAKELHFNEKYMRYDVEADRQEIDYTYKRTVQKLDRIFADSNPVYSALKADLNEKISEMKKRSN